MNRQNVPFLWIYDQSFYPYVLFFIKKQDSSESKRSNKILSTMMNGENTQCFGFISRTLILT